MWAASPGRRAKHGNSKGPSPSGKSSGGGRGLVHIYSPTRFLDFYFSPSFHEYRFPHFVCSTEFGSE